MRDDASFELPLVVEPVLHLKNVSIGCQDSDPNATKLLRRLLEMEDNEPARTPSYAPSLTY
jgi:hypothetical protein